VQGSGDRRSSPRIAAKDKGKGKANVPWKERQKRLRLPTVRNPDSQTADAGRSDDAGGGDDVDSANEANKKKRHIQAPAMRCSPEKWLDIVKALSKGVIDDVKAKSFGGLLLFKPSSMDRKFLMWIMQKLNPKSMTLEIGSGKSIPVNEHSVWCAFQIPKRGCDPPSMTDEEAQIRRNELGQQICPFTYDKNGIRIADIMKGLKSGRLVGALGLRAFFMAAFQTLLFSNTDTHIRLEDVIYTEDINNISNVNWCKVVVDNLNREARLFKNDFSIKGINTPLTRCDIFLMVTSFFLYTFFLPPFAIIFVFSEFFKCCSNNLSSRHVAIKLLSNCYL
jgi:hypothetical protein